MMEYHTQIQRHYEHQWSSSAECRSWEHGPLDQLAATFTILEFAPRPSRSIWTYATCCMSQPDDIHSVEIHLFSSTREESHIELLTAIAHYHRTSRRLALGHIVNFGRPWFPKSECSFGLLSLPYLDGPSLEVLPLPAADKAVRFLWLIPITARERDYAKRFGGEAFKQKLEESQFNYLDPQRRSVV